MVREEDGQALVLSILIIGLAVAALAGLGAAQNRLIDLVRDDRAGEAAVEAAGAVVADQLIARRNSLAVIGDGAVISLAASAANEIAAANGRGTPSVPRLQLVGDAVEIDLRLAGRLHRAAVRWP